MTYLVTDNCIKCKHMDCVEVCPVDCFYEGENFLTINPDECIDCGVCAPECGPGAILSDAELGDEKDKWYDINLKYSLEWPVITVKGEKPFDADEWDGIPNKFEEHFSELPGKGSY
jgi:ferredoxin